jgi:dTDP-4-amino-4,6-dideoxygalactose transaminase
MVSTVPFNRPNLRFARDVELENSVLDILRIGPYLNGKYLTEFEQEFSNFLGVDFTIGVSSGTSALELAFRALDTSRGYGSVVLARLGMKPVYFDINFDGSPNFDSFKERISNQTCAVLLTNLYGLSSDYTLFFEEARRHSIFIVEDCAQSAGANYPNSALRSGSLSDISTFSFYPTKNLSTVGDAGAITTNDSFINDKIRKLREYGWTAKYRIELQGGFNYRMDEIHSMVLTNQLKKLDDYNKKRRDIWRMYNLALNNSSYQLIGRDDSSFIAHLAVIKGENIERLQNFLNLSGVETAVHYPIADYNQPAFSSFKTEQFVCTDSHVASILSIPLYPELKSDEVQYISNLLSDFSHET